MSMDGQFENADSKAYWAAAREGRLLFQKCCACGHVQHPPRHQCSACWTDGLAEIESSGRGRIESLTVVRRAPIASFRNKVPYVVVSVVMDEGPRMIANLLDDEALTAKPDDHVTICFVPDDAGNVLPQFKRPAHS